MIQIQPRVPSPAGVPSQDAPETAAPTTAPGAPPADPVVAHALAEGGADVQAKFDALFGDAQARTLYADKRGGGHGTNNTNAPRKSDPLAGTTLPGQAEKVVVKRSLGDPRGYETKNHAIAWARAAGLDTAMVVRRGDRWHAVETNVAGQSFSGAKGKITDGVKVGKLDPVVYERLKNDAFNEKDPSKLDAKWKALASYALGIPESEIKVIGKGDIPSSKHVNINLSPDFDAEGRAASFRDPPWVQLGRAAFDRPANAVATLAHEEVHAGHRRLAIEWFDKYQQAPHGKMSFRDWMAEQTKGKGFEGVRLAELVAGVQDGTYATTELEAHIEAARVAFASGDLTQARTDLNKVRTLPVLPAQLQTKEIYTAALKELRDGLSGDARKVFDEVVKTARGASMLNDGRLR